MASTLETQALEGDLVTQEEIERYKDIFGADPQFALIFMKTLPLEQCPTRKNGL